MPKDLNENNIFVLVKTETGCDRTNSALIEDGRKANRAGDLKCMLTESKQTNSVK